MAPISLQQAQKEEKPGCQDLPKSLLVSHTPRSLLETWSLDQSRCRWKAEIHLSTVWFIGTMDRDVPRSGQGLG